MSISTLRGERKPTQKWTQKDRLIALALTVYESGLCKGCGQPLDHTTGDRPRDYAVREYHCSGCYELESRTKKHEPGQKVYLFPEE